MSFFASVTDASTTLVALWRTRLFLIVFFFSHHGLQCSCTNLSNFGGLLVSFWSAHLNKRQVCFSQIYFFYYLGLHSSLNPHQLHFAPNPGGVAPLSSGSLYFFFISSRQVQRLSAPPSSLLRSVPLFHLNPEEACFCFHRSSSSSTILSFGPLKFIYTYVVGCTTHYISLSRATLYFTQPFDGHVLGDISRLTNSTYTIPSFLSISSNYRTLTRSQKWSYSSTSLPL